MSYPAYLHGGLPRRDYLTNAKWHLRARWGYCCDIENFFPSITRQQVFNIWKEFFGFAPEVSGLLTDLTTLDGGVPQGSLTASYIANLALWKSEWKLVKELERAGFTYTRFIDDVTITTQRQQSSLELTKNVSKVHRLADSNDFHIKRSKSKILNSQEAMLVLGIDVSGFSVKRTRRHRKLLTSEVMSAAGKVAGMGCDIEAEKYLNKLRGRVTELRRFNPGQADRLLTICPRPK